MTKRQAQPSRGPTRKQLARSRKEQEQLRWIYIGLGTVAALIIIALAFGLYQSFVVAPNVPVATVNGTDITTGDYQDRVKFERYLLEEQYLQFQQQQATALSQADSEELAEFLGTQYQQLINQVLQQRSFVDRQTVNTMIDDRLVETEAASRGITVSDEEVTEFINQFVAGRLGGLTIQAASATSTARAEASATAELWTPTPTLTPSPTLTFTEEITPTPTPADTPTPAPTPTLNVIGPEALNTEYANWLTILDENVGIGEAEYRQIMRMLLLRDKLRQVLADEVPESAEQARARHILVETEEEANEVIERLDAGEEFSDLAAELSLDPGSAADGGDLGFVPRGRFVESFDEAVFTLPVGEIGEPVQSQFGWHIIEVLEREVRELSAANYQQAQQLALSEWLGDARIEATIEDFWTEDMAPEDPFLGQ
jgi:parvulin-like peptidyl-prolyl isomerase